MPIKQRAAKAGALIAVLLVAACEGPGQPPREWDADEPQVIQAPKVQPRGPKPGVTTVQNPDGTFTTTVCCMPPRSKKPKP